VLRRRVAALLRVQQPKVWQEMKRQRALVSELNKPFGAVPEAMDWEVLPLFGVRGWGGGAGARGGAENAEGDPGFWCSRSSQAGLKALC